MSKIRFILAQSRLAILATGVAFIILVGVIDYRTGPEISFSIFYLLPISLVTWWTDRRTGIISASIGVITWLMADLTTQTGYSHILIPYWNAVLRFLVFLGFVLLESSLKDLNRDLDHKVMDRTTQLEAEIVERKKIENRLEQYAKRLEILYEIDRAILGAHSLETVAQTTIQNIQNLLPCDRASCILFDLESQQVLVFDTSTKDSDRNPSMEIIPIERFTDYQKLINSLEHENDLPNSLTDPFLTQIFRAQNYRSRVIIPILIHNELIGALGFMAYDANVLHSEALEIGREVANQLGIAIRQARLVDQLRQDQENLQTLSKRLLNVQETERRNIARELHDEVGQALTGIRITLEMAMQLQTDVIPESIGRAHDLLVELMERVSRLSLELRPAPLDDFGLLPALLWFLDRYSVQTSIQVILKHNGLEQQRFASEVETAAYRIVQEALTNIARHARVNQAIVTLWFDQDILGIQVEDKGIGFDLETQLAKGSSSGLLGMQERALLLNGNLTIESTSEIGTRVLAEIPVNGVRLSKEES